MTETQRYSDKRLTDDFTIYVLFSEPLQAGIEEVFDAAREDYPGLEWVSTQMGGPMIDTRTVTLSTDLGVQIGDDGVKKGGRTLFTGSPGRCDVNWGDIFDKSRFIFPEAKAAVARHTDYLAINVGSPAGDTSIAARFDAARRMTCLGAVFAKLPITVGIYFPSADLIVKPQDWIGAADTAMKGEIPVMFWMGLYVNGFEWNGPDPRPVTAGSIGLAAFNGHEIVMPQVRMEPADAVHWVAMTIRMLLESDHEFFDGDTLGVENGGKPIRIRHLKEGQMEMQTDTWVLFHQRSLLDDVKMCGERSRPPAPEGVDNEYVGDWNSLKNRLYSYVTGASR